LLIDTDAGGLIRRKKVPLRAGSPVNWAGQGVLYGGASRQPVELAELLPASRCTDHSG